MTDTLNSIKERMEDLTDDELRKIIYVDYFQYRQEAIEFAKKELFGRTDYNIWENSSLTLKELLATSKIDDIESQLLNLYSDEEKLISSYRAFLKKLYRLDSIDNGNTYISIKKLDIKNGLKEDEWEILGEDLITHETFNIDYCLWSEWLSFFVIKEQLQALGRESYLVYCIKKMTSISFNENEIQNVFNKINNTELHINEPEDKKIYIPKEVPIDSFISDGIKKKNNLKSNKKSKKYIQVRPWIRLFARAIDTSIWSTLIFYTWNFTSAKTYKMINSLALGLLLSAIEFIVWIFIEAFLLSKIGFTFGKWLLNVEVKDKNSNRLSYQLALKRTFSVWFFGEALSVPFVNIATYISSYNRLKRRGKTKWDESFNTNVYHKKIEVYKAIIAAIILIFLPFALVILRYTKII